MFALKIQDKDNVATVFSTEVSKGVSINVKDKKGNTETLMAGSAIPYGHKIATVQIGKGTKIVKYGEVIGVATADIDKGGHVHVQNIDSLRGRGDLQGGE